MPAAVKDESEIENEDEDEYVSQVFSVYYLIITLPAAADS